MRYWAFNFVVFLCCIASGFLSYLLVVAASAGLLGLDETPGLGSPLWTVLLVVFPLLCDAFLTVAFRTPVGGLTAQLFPSRRRRLREKFDAARS